MRVRIGVSLLLTTGLLAACQGPEPTKIANPAAVYCEEQGGQFVLQNGRCVLSDGKEVDAWTWYREERCRQEPELCAVK